jgi:hypothetical protein
MNGTVGADYQLPGVVLSDPSESLTWFIFRKRMNGTGGADYQLPGVVLPDETLQGK